MVLTVTALPLTMLTAMALPSDETPNLVVKSIPRGKIGRSMNITFSIRNDSGTPWEDVYVAIEDNYYSIIEPGTEQLDYVFAGDLLNQCIATSYSLRAQQVPFFGLYGACSTMAESLSLGAMLLDGGFGSHIAAMTSSHFCSAERQYRNPLEYGGQKPPTAQWTTTGSGAVVLSKQGKGPYVTHVTTGKVMDKGITDANNMGAAMAPAAYDTLRAHFQDTGRSPDFYDLIVTGDLGSLGKEIVLDFFQRDGVDLSKNYDDCGVLLFDAQKQDVHAGGSGCGCSAVVLTGYLLRQMALGKLNNLLFCGTGALHSPTSTMQGESIPGICHAVAITTLKEGTT